MTVVLLGALVSLISIIGPTMYLIEQHDAHTSNMIQRSMDPPERMVPIDDLKNEERFQNTIKSCLPQHNPSQCKQYIPPTPPGEASQQRVVLLAPPGEISGPLLNRISAIVNHHNERSDTKQDLNIALLTRSHVPPYGYGKTHGLTKIIRLVPQPLLLEVSDALQSLLQPHETYTDITLEDVKTGLRLIIRYHCRLSHIAAHTAILSVNFTELITDPNAVNQALDEFLIPKDYTAENREVDDKTGGGFFPDDDEGGLLEAQVRWGTHMLTYIQFHNPHVEVERVLDQVLMEELDQSKNLTAWPCLPFWAAGNPDNPTVLPSELTQRLARELSPDCNDPMASCWVERDKCEAAEDAVCSGNK
jgi:hypothetical protein